VRYEGGDRYLYLAIRKADFPVMWSAGERSRAAGTVVEGRYYVTRDEFAAVVAERAGTTLKTLTRVRKESRVDRDDRAAGVPVARNPHRCSRSSKALNFWY
jgi:hypothetical protein